MTSEELASIRAHLATVSPYPWRGDSDDGARMRRAVLDANGDLVVFGSDHDGDPYYGIHEAPGQEYAPNEALIIQAPVYVAALLDEVDRLTAEVERLRSDYEHGHAAGDAARMLRCKQDVARALRLDGESPPVWGDLVAEVARAAMRAAAKAVRGEP